MDSEKELEESTLSSVNLRMEASSPSYGSEGETRNHRDAAEHISSIEKENFNLKLRIYHMEEHLNSNGGQDFQSILQQKVENEELKNELDENQKLLLAANQGISCLKRELEDEKKLRGKTENELSLLQTELRKTNDEKQRMKKQIERLREDARRSREKAAHSYESTEMQLNDSLNENRELQDKLEDLENNNMSLVDELSAKEGELSRVHDENDDLVDEVERLRAENVRLASQASRVPRKPRSYDMGIQCEGRMCEKASQTRNLDYAPRSRLPRPDNTRHMQRTTSVGNLSDRTSSPVRSYGSSRDLRIPVSTPHRYSESSSRYQSLVQGQNKELSSLRRQLDQARLSCTRLRTTLDDLQRADYLEQRRLISTARRTLRKLEGELENRDESATSDCASESDYDYDSNIRSSILPVLTEIKSMIAGLRNTPKTELDERKITRSIRDAFDAIDSGHPTSPNDLSEAQLLPGIVQDLQNLRLKFEQTVSSSSTKSERQRPLSFDSGCQTDVSGTTISLYNDELSALRDALSQKDCEIDKLRAEAIQREMHPAVNSSPIKHSHKRKSFFENDGPLTPPLSSGTEESFMPSGSDLRNLREGLNQGRLLSKSIYHKVELGVEDTEEMAEEVHDFVQLLDEMSRMLQKMQYKACSQESDNAENIRLRNKVHALEKMLATTVSRIQKNSLLKQGIDHQISSKLNYTAGILGRARINLGNSTPSTSRATSLNGDSL